MYLGQGFLIRSLILEAGKMLDPKIYLYIFSFTTFMRNVFSSSKNGRIQNYMLAIIAKVIQDGEAYGEVASQMSSCFSFDDDKT